MKSTPTAAALRLVVTAALVCVFSCGCPEQPNVVVFSDPLTAEEHARLGAIHERQGNMDRAFDEYLAALKQDPKNVVALTGLGNVSLARGRRLTAAGYYKRALDEEPDNPAVMNNLAHAWLGAGRPKKALEWAERAADARPDDPRILETRMRARAAAGDADGALEDLDKIRELCAGLSPDADPTVVEACGSVLDEDHRE